MKILEIGDQVFKRGESEAINSYKYHIDNFKNIPSCHLVNPTKPENGNICSKILNKINDIICHKANIN